MNKALIRSAVIASLTCVSTFAATQSYTGYTSPLSSGTPTLANDGSGLVDGTTSLTVPQWNPASFPGATLTGVSYVLTYQGYSDFTVHSVSVPANFTVSLLSGTSTITSTTAGGPTGTASFINFAALGGTPDATYSNISAAFGPVYTSTHSAISSTFNDNSNLAAYTGTGTIGFNLTHASNPSFNAQATGGGAVTTSQTSLGRSASSLTITYTYTLTEVPEPSTYAAMGFVGLVAGATIWRRRQAAKKA